MQGLSPRAGEPAQSFGADSWEVWLHAPGAHLADVPELGSFDSQAAAESAACDLRAWLRGGSMSRALLRPDREDTLAILEMPQKLRDRGIDPAAVRVEVYEFGAAETSYCPDVRLYAGGDDPDDTAVLTPEELRAFGG